MSVRRGTGGWRVWSRLISWGRIGDGSRRDCAKNSTIYTSAFSSKEAFVIRNPLLCEFPKLNPFIIIITIAVAVSREQNEQKRAKLAESNEYKLQLQWTRIAAPLPPTHPLTYLWTLVNTRTVDRELDRMLLKLFEANHLSILYIWAGSVDESSTVQSNARRKLELKRSAQVLLLFETDKTEDGAGSGKPSADSISGRMRTKCECAHPFTRATQLIVPGDCLCLDTVQLKRSTTLSLGTYTKMARSTCS